MKYWIKLFCILAVPTIAALAFRYYSTEAEGKYARIHGGMTATEVRMVMGSEGEQPTCEDGLFREGWVFRGWRGDIEVYILYDDDGRVVAKTLTKLLPSYPFTKQLDQKSFSR